MIMLPKKATKLRFEELDGRIKRNLIQAGEDLMEIQEKELFREGGFSSMADYCISIGKNYHWAWRQMKAAETAKELPKATEIPNVATALAIRKVALPIRRQVVKAALSESGGNLTPKAIEDASNNHPETIKKRILPKDGTGLEIPPEIQTFWDRNEEANHLLGLISKIKSTLETGQKENDPLFRFVGISGVLANLQMAYSELKCAKSFAVCPDCNGLFADDCATCRGRGTLPEFNWNLIDEQKKSLRTI